MTKKGDKLQSSAAAINPNGASDLWQMQNLNRAAADVREAHAKLEAADVALRKFRQENCIVLGTQLYFQCRTIDGRAALDREWHGLVVKRDQLLQKHNQALQVYSELKMTMEVPR